MSHPPPRTPRFYVRTYGCQMNELDSAKMARLLERDGWEAVDGPAEADVMVVNTCSVREKPTHKVVSLIGKIRLLKHSRPDLRLLIAGCFAAQEGQQLLDRFPTVDAVIGPAGVERVAEAARRVRTERFVDLSEEGGFVPDPTFRGSGRVCASVAIQRGCDHGCTYCIVPQVRGGERFRDPAEILREVSHLLRQGARDITLLGQNVNRYRGSGADGEPLRFPDLLRRVAALDRTLRVRFLTSNPWDLEPDLVRALGEEPNVCPYLHLPVQSGSDRVLRRMGRPHGRRDYLDLLERLRSARPDLALSSDILVGFPGEDESDFAATLELVEQVRFTALFVFAYSPRPGTPAALLEDDVPKPEKNRRVRTVLELQERSTAEILQGWVGREVRVLLDTRGRDSLTGRAPDYTLVHVDGPDEWIGREVTVRIDEALRHTLRGTVR